MTAVERARSLLPRSRLYGRRASDRDELRHLGSLALLAIVVLAAALRFSTLGVQSFSDDEQFTVWLIKMSFGHMVATVPQSEATPHLYYILAWGWARLFGTGEIGMRLLPALLGTLTVLAVYRAGSVAASRRVGLAGALFTAVNPFLVWYSQEARSYPLAILLGAIALMGFLSFLKSHNGRALTVWAVAAAASLVTHYFAVFLVIPEAVWLLKRAAGRRTLGAVALPAVVGLAVLPLALHQRSVIKGLSDPHGRSLAQRVVAVPKNFLIGYSVPAEVEVAIVSGSLVALALLLAWFSGRGRERSTAAIVTAVAGSALALSVAVALIGLDYVTSRNLIVLLVPVAVLAGCGFAIGRVGPAALCLLSIVSIATAMGIATDVRYQRRDWRGAARALGPARTGRVLVFSPGFVNTGPFRVYFGPSTLLGGRSARVREISVVALATDAGFGPKVPGPPTGPTPSPPPGFRTSALVRAPSYRIVTFVAPRPTSVTPSELLGLGFRGADYQLVWQEART